MEPLISIVIPTYNHAHFLGRALQAVINQTYTNWEAVIVDNHSQDNTIEVIESFNDHRIKFLQIHNQGVIAASHNLGIISARGEWIAFLDSDDYWYPQKLEVVTDCIRKEPGWDVVSTDELLINVNTGEKRVLRYGPATGSFYRTMILEGNRLSPSATLVRTDFIRQQHILFSESKEYITVEDYDFWLHLALADAKFRFIPSVQGEYTIHATNGSAQMERHNRNCRILLHDHIFRIQQFDPDHERLWKTVLPRLQLSQVGQLIADGKKMQACKLIGRALLTNPLNTLSFLLSRLRTRKNK